MQNRLADIHSVLLLSSYISIIYTTTALLVYILRAYVSESYNVHIGLVEGTYWLLCSWKCRILQRERVDRQEYDRPGSAGCMPKIQRF